MFEIRSATTEDKTAIQHIYLSAVGPSAIQLEPHWDSLITAGGLVVAETGDRVIGFGGIDVNATEQVKWIYLLPQDQRAGVGSEILRQLEHIGWQAGLNSIRLHAAPGAVEFYRRHGYEAVAQPQQAHDHEGVEMVKHRRD